MRVKAANSGVFSICILILFGVGSVQTHAYSASRSSAGDPSTFSRPSREGSADKRSEDLNSNSTPFSPGTHNLSVGVGQVFLLGSLSNHYENSIGPELHYTYGVSDLFSFQSNFGYHSHSSGALSIWNLSGGLRANLAYFDSLVPFATVGLGFYFPSYTLSNNATVSALLYGMQFGTGIDLLISRRVFFGAKATYNSMFDSSKQASDGTSHSLGGAFLSFMIHAGLTF
jgi:hypothetical protein